MSNWNGVRSFASRYVWPLWMYCFIGLLSLHRHHDLAAPWFHHTALKLRPASDILSAVMTSRSDIDKLLEGILVDAYGEDEQLWAFRQAIEDEVSLPAEGAVIGEPVQITKIDYDGNPQRGLRATCRKPGGKTYQYHSRVTRSICPMRKLTQFADTGPTICNASAYARLLIWNPRPRQTVYMCWRSPRSRQ